MFINGSNLFIIVLNVISIVLFFFVVEKVLLNGLVRFLLFDECFKVNDK